jgi:uncharacterized protein (DUF1330 family)
MAAYVVARVTVKDPAVYEAYRREVPATIARYGGRFLVRGGATEVKEGSWRDRTVILEFADLAAARGWYASPEYGAILPVRLAASEGDVIIVEGVPPA